MKKGSQRKLNGSFCLDKRCKSCTHMIRQILWRYNLCWQQSTQSIEDYINSFSKLCNLRYAHKEFPKRKFTCLLNWELRHDMKNKGGKHGVFLFYRLLFLCGMMLQIFGCFYICFMLINLTNHFKRVCFCQYSRYYEIQ